MFVCLDSNEKEKEDNNRTPRVDIYLLRSFTLLLKYPDILVFDVEVVPWRGTDNVDLPQKHQ